MSINVLILHGVWGGAGGGHIENYDNDICYLICTKLCNRLYGNLTCLLQKDLRHST